MKTNKKQIIFFTVLLLLFILFVYFYKKPHDYTKKYNVSAFTINERYNSKSGFYSYDIKYNNILYPYLISHEYINKRNHITKVEINNSNGSVCIKPNSKYMEFYPLCSVDNNIVSFSTTKNKMDYKYLKINKLDKSYKKLKLNYLYEKNYLLYNYSNFYLINNNNTKDIDIFKEDNYDVNMIYQYDKYLIVADYNYPYFIKRFIVINSENGKKDYIDCKDEISYESRFLGVYKNNIYLIDEKNKIEYQINIRKKKIDSVDGSIYDGNKLIKFKEKTIVNKKLFFYKDKTLKYYIEDNKLFQKINNISILLSNNASNIIYNDEDNVYYVYNENLYVYNKYDGNILLMSNFEWNFKNNNMIFIF